MENNLKNKVAFITGAAHGQGRAVAIALAKEGCDIVALDVAKKIEYPDYTFGCPEELVSLKRAIIDLGRECISFCADVRDD